MKKIIILLLTTSSQLIFSQEKQTASVEKSIFGIQASIIGAFINNEIKLSNTISLKTEVGLDGGVFLGQKVNGTGYIFTPLINIEPRYYYNLEKRLTKNKNIKNNSGNFLTLGIHYLPNWFVISSEKGNGIVPEISFIPKWGIKRTIGNHFNYEAGIGIGYVKFLDNSYKKSSTGALDLHLRVGYSF